MRRGAQSWQLLPRSFLRLLRRFAGRLFHFGSFERNRSANEQIRNDPYEWKEQNPKHEPREREPEYPHGHQLRPEVIRQWQPEQRDEKGGRAGERELELSCLEGVKKRFAV